MSSLNEVSKPSSAVLVCQQKVQVRISSKQDGTRDKYISRRCRVCWACVTSEKNDHVGKLLAQGASSARIELWTLTYDDLTVESRLGAKQRIPDHLQRFQKAFRQRERAALLRHNKKEKKAAAIEDRDPLLVDTSQSYIKFFPVYEFGSKNERGHFHVLVFFASHVPVKFHGFGLVQPVVCPDEAVRIWDLKEVRGPTPEKLPPDANNPDIIDRRVRKHGSQKHALWPHGFVNIECVSHDLRAVDFRGNPINVRCDRQEIVRSCFYLLKYLGKPETKKDGRAQSEKELRDQTQGLHEARGGSRLYRTGSRGLGVSYAKAFGRERALRGVALRHTHFKVDGAQVPRSRESLQRLRSRLEARGMSYFQVENYIIEASKMVFQMHGGMLAAAADTYIEIATSKGKSPVAMGEVAQIRLRQLASQAANEWLRSPEGEFRRSVARDLTGLDKLWAHRELQSCSPMVAQMVSGLFFKGEMPKCILPPEPYVGHLLGEDPPAPTMVLERHGSIRSTEMEKLEATHAAVKLVSSAYKRLGIDAGKFQAAKNRLGCVKDFSTPFLTFDQLLYRGNVDEITQGIYEQTVNEEWEAFFAGDNEAADLLYALSVAQGKVFQPPIKPWCVDEDYGPSERLLRWLNHSDQYEWPKRREENINRYCAVRVVNEDHRYIITPDGRTLLARRGYCDTHRDTVSASGVTARHKVTIFKWGYREIHSVSEFESSLSGGVSLRGFDKSCPIFATEQPFKNCWAMRSTALTNAVLALPVEHSTGPRPTVKIRKNLEDEQLLLDIPF